MFFIKAKDKKKERAKHSESESESSVLLVKNIAPSYKAVTTHTEQNIITYQMTKTKLKHLFIQKVLFLNTNM